MPPPITSSPTSLTRQTILDEDTYTASLSHIIKRDFFPTLDRLAATNAYLAALESEDAGAIADSIRGLSALTPRAAGEGDRYRREREVADLQGTPFISRASFGAGMETPVRSVERDEPQVKRQRVDVSAGLDNFQASYTSQDNSSFIDILQHENRLKREKYAWAYAAEAKAKQDRLKLEQGRRQLLIEAGGYVPDDGLIRERKAVEPPMPRLAVMPGEGGSSEGKGERRAIEAGPGDEEGMANTSDALVRRDIDSSEGALVRRAPALNAPDISQTQLTIPNALPEDTTTSTAADADKLHEIPLHPGSHLARALAHAGLPETAIVTRQGTLVPQREVASGAGDGLGRGDADRKEREEMERRVMGEERDERGTLVPTWGYKARNALMFGPDADVNPVLPGPRPALTAAQLRTDPPEIRHVNTRLAEDEEGEAEAEADTASRRALSPSRSRVAAAIAGKQYQPSTAMPKYGDYTLVPAAPSPSPSDLGPDAIKELMTWGTLLGTPRALGGTADGDDDLVPNNFKISEPGRRDDIGRRLATSASRSMRERAQGFGTTPKGLAVLSGSRGRAGSMGPPAVPSPGATTPRRRAEALTPAGRTLLQRSVLGTPERSGGLGLPRSAGTRSRGEVMERAGGWTSSGSRQAHKRTWTPSPAPHRS